VRALAGRVPVAFVGSLGLLAAYPAAAETPIGRQDLCVTKGEIGAAPGGRLTIEEPEVRAVSKIPTPQAAEIRFTYRGPSKGTKPLGSGEIRRQLGIKLRAQDSCNLVYVMWRIEPEAKLVVSIKSNPGQEVHAQCGTQGYTNIKPMRHAPLPRSEVGSEHRLRAELRGRELAVFADGRPVWEGTLGPVIDHFDGPVGLRTDNVRVEMQYAALDGRPDPGARLAARMQAACGGQSEGD
jgi:hypothetical protein